MYSNQFHNYNNINNNVINSVIDSAINYVNDLEQDDDDLSISSDMSIETCDYNNRKFYMVIPEIYNKKLYGNPKLDGHLIIAESFDYLNKYQHSLDDFIYDIYQISNFHKSFRRQAMNNDNSNSNSKFTKHSLIRNYNHIIKHINYMIPEIAQCILLPTGERMCIIKTMWLKFIQRKWKQVYQKRQEIMNNRKQIASILFRERNGKWGSNCNNLPSLKGMLYNYK
jgi:hypothetical protein